MSYLLIFTNVLNNCCENGSYTLRGKVGIEISFNISCLQTVVIFSCIHRPHIAELG
uniref:Uncharacterized protein n=1 Tax=Anguilla anguilla TaxID=7936 RepID=A0A0E9T752_ANGAN